MLGQRRRRWANNNPTLGHSLVCAGVSVRLMIYEYNSDLILFSCHVYKRHHQQQQNHSRKQCYFDKTKK